MTVIFLFIYLFKYWFSKQIALVLSFRIWSWNELRGKLPSHFITFAMWDTIPSFIFYIITNRESAATNFLTPRRATFTDSEIDKTYIKITSMSGHKGKEFPSISFYLKISIYLNWLKIYLFIIILIKSSTWTNYSWIFLSDCEFSPFMLQTEKQTDHFKPDRFERCRKIFYLSAITYEFE